MRVYFVIALFTYCGALKIEDLKMAKFLNTANALGITFLDTSDQINRLALFNANDSIITAMNAKEGLSFSVGHNQFSFMTKEEFSAMLLAPEFTPDANK
jgi:hypothetical protein